VIAFAGILAHQLTGSATPDAVGSILVGVLLAVVAILLIRQNRRFLVGAAVDPDLRAAALQRLLAHPAIAQITYLHIEYVGPGRVFLVAAVDLAGDPPSTKSPPHSTRSRTNSPRHRVSLGRAHPVASRRAALDPDHPADPLRG
jgi:divalent metal cation (Fe/Co/Zn/Cd) transporter